MLFQGLVQPRKTGEKYLSIEIPDLGIFTQGKNEKDCLKMAKSAVEDLLEIKVEVLPVGKTTFIVRAIDTNDVKKLMGRFLETLREKAQMSTRQVAERIGSTSPNSYAQYEQGKSIPGMDKLSSFVEAMAPGYDIEIKIRKVG